MDDLFYPQLTSGALAQYPLRKNLVTRTIKNVLADGNMIVLPDSHARRTVWKLKYSNLSWLDIQSLASHFNACKGPLHAFTFIDPAGNMLASSTDLTTAVWQKSSAIQIQTNTADPFGTTSAHTITNYGQNTQELAQVVSVPVNYQYCWSMYATAVEQTNITVFRRGLNTQQSSELTIRPGWTRFVSSGRLNDSGSALTVGIGLNAGQQISIFGVQLEAQISPSRYQPTAGNGGVYTNAHWAMEQFQITAEDVNSYATTASIEATA